MEYTLEQRQALAMAAARRRMQQAQPIETPAFEREAQDRLDRPTLHAYKDMGNRALDVLGYPEHLAYQAGGKVTDLTGSPEAGFATNLGIQAVPAAIGGLARPGAQAVRGGAEWMMQKALKPTRTDFARGKADRAVGTLLDEGINVNRGGMDELRRRGLAENARAQDVLNQSTATIPRNSPGSAVLDDITRLESQNPLPSGPRGAMEGVYNEFVSNPLIPQNMSLPQANTYKQTLYQGLRDRYGTLSEGEEAARKALARGLRRDIEGAAPDLAPINAHASDLWNALNVAERRAMIAGNNNPLGLTALAGHPGAAAAFALDRSDTAKSIAARLLNNMQGAPGIVGGGWGGSYMGRPEQ